MNCKKETEKIVTFIQDTFKKKDFEKAVIGISGGLDSAVVATLLVRALGKENVYGESLPCGEQKDIQDAKLVANKLRIKYEVIDIASAVDGLKKVIGYQDEPNVSIGNIKARTRMIILYDLSAYYNALVVGTGNKTELKLGYFTLHGDGACALEPIGHLYKTQVFELARYLNVPEKIIQKKPSAGFWEGQTDEDELGITYEVIDEWFYLMERHTPNEGQGIWTDKTYKQIRDRIKKNKFKQEPPAIIGG